MPSRAASYYHWSQDKPCTTNQNYGFNLKADMFQRQAEDSLKPKKPVGIFGYTRPFSNLGFFPEISVTKSMTSQRAQTAPLYLRKSCPPGAINKFDINRGYSMGHVPITSRVVKREFPADVKLVRHKTVPPTFKHTSPKEKDLFLWHTLSGCLVHVKNHTPEPKPDPYRRTAEELRAMTSY